MALFGGVYWLSSASFTLWCVLFVFFFLLFLLAYLGQSVSIYNKVVEMILGLFLEVGYLNLI